MEEPSIRLLIRKYLEGHCTEQEKREVEIWYSSFENDIDILEFISADELTRLEEIMFKNIKRDIREKEKGGAHRRPAAYYVRFVSVGVAAMLCVGLGVVWLVKTITPPEESTGYVARQRSVIENHEKSIKRVSLPDSSVVWLHPDSRIAFPPEFTQIERNLELTGEAFFEVRPMTDVPFVVYSGDLRTKVLGTSFKVRAYRSDPYAVVSVMTGKVSVGRIYNTLSGPADGKPAEADVILTPDESVTYSHESGSFNKEKTSGNRHMVMWKKANLNFKGVSVKSVLNALSSVYNVRIRVTDEEINGYLLRADFTGMNLPDALEILEHSLGLTYEIEENQILLKAPE